MKSSPHLSASRYKAGQENDRVGGRGTMQPFRLVALVGALSLPVTSHSQTCELPALPDATITAAQDRDHMMCALSLTFPPLPPRLADPNRPVNAWPVNAANPEG